MTHKEFKYLTKANPLVVGVYNGYVDIDEVARRDYLIVKDCMGNLAAYLNPQNLKNLTKLEVVEKQLKIMRRSKLRLTDDIVDFYNKFVEACREYDYLTKKCGDYQQIVKKAEKEKKVQSLVNYSEKYGMDILENEIEETGKKKLIK